MDGVRQRPLRSATSPPGESRAIAAGQDGTAAAGDRAMDEVTRPTGLSTRGGSARRASADAPALDDDGDGGGDRGGGDGVGDGDGDGDDDLGDFDDVTLPEPIRVTPLDRPFDHAQVVACERALRAARRQERRRRPGSLLGAGDRTVAARTATRRNAALARARWARRAAALSLLATTVALALSGALV
jgi:hypothetical protein